MFPSLDVITRCAEELGVSRAELLGDEDAPDAPKMRGPKSKLDQRIERLRQLPKKEQEFVLRMIDTVLEQAER